MRKEKIMGSINLDEKLVKYWISLVMKVNNGFELDEKEMKLLGVGLELFNEKNASGEIKAYVRNAKEYFEKNKSY